MPGFFSEDFIQEVISANDIADVIGDYVQLKRQSSGMVGLCPFHKEKTPSFHVSPDKQLYHCFGCGVGGTVIHFIMQAENFDFVEAVKFLAERAKIPVPENGGNHDNELYERKQRIYQMNRLAARFFYTALFSENAKEAQAYVKKRGLTKDTIRTYGIGYAPDAWDALLRHLEQQGFHRGEIVDAGLAIANEKGKIYDRFRNRLMFPIFDVRGNVIAFSGRILSGDGDGRKYVNSPETPVFSKSKNLFSLNLAKKSGKDSLILVEGQMDVISLYQSGIKNAIATLGTAITSEHAWLISRYAKKVQICYDSDSAGQKATQRAIEKFEGMDVSVSVIEIPQGKDPDEYIKKHSAEAFEDLATAAKNTTEYQLSEMKKKYNLEDIGQKIDFVNEAVNLLADLSNEVERDVHIRALAADIDSSPEAIYAEVRKALYRKNRRRERDTLRDVVKSEQTAERKDRQQGIDHKVSELEAQMLGLLFADRSVYQKFASQMPKEKFSIPLHRSLADEIYSAWESGTAPNAADMMLKFPDADPGQLSGILSQSAKTGESIQAAEDLYQSLQGVWLDRAIEEAAGSGNVTELGNLLKQKKQFEERRRSAQ